MMEFLVAADEFVLAIHRRVSYLQKNIEKNSKLTKIRWKPTA